MAYDISPERQNIDTLFSSTTYSIDFYQREYKWNSVPVLRLLDDIFYKFNQEYKTNQNLDPNKETISEKYSWYYLNTYVTNSVGGKVYIVDGQQRLTTLFLILVKLSHQCKQHESKLKDWIERKIVGHEGFDNKFWILHEKNLKVQQHLFEFSNTKTIDDINTVTAFNMVTNYSEVSKWMDRELKTKHKLETFIFYFLYRIALINLAVEQTDVPMVFEVINDRGVRLKPYEIIKGKLLGQIDKNELSRQKLDETWDTQIKKINDYKEDEADNFFIYFLKAKYSDTIGESKKFDSDYHRVMFNDEFEKILHLKHNPNEVKSFLKNTFKYYSDLYSKIYEYYTSYQEEYCAIFFNRLNEQDTQFLLIISACSLNDPEENDKIKTISVEVDRLFSLLQLQGSHDSNSFNELIYKISYLIREKPVSTYRRIFDEKITEHLTAIRNIQVSIPFQYSYFKDIGVQLNVRFKRYYFARVEKFLADNMNLKMKHTFADLVQKTGSKTGFHVEHILSNNKFNLSLFGKDEELFEKERNRLGGLLLLKGKDNQSSNNENYSAKLKSYANTLYWNETLRKDTYKSKLDLTELKKKYNLKLVPLLFGQREVEARQQLLFDISKIIWK